MIGVIADDTTGANDIGIMFRKGGYKVKMLTYEEQLEPKGDCDVLIIDTDSRLDPLEMSRAKVYEAAKILKKAGCTTYHKKTCSVFRGNIGEEFDAMLDSLGENFAVISLAFPKNGRTTLKGIHRVNGLLLEESNFASDPVHPMTSSNLVEILSSETERGVCSIDIGIVRQGAHRLKEEIEKKKIEYNYCIIDSETNEDLNIVAQAIAGYPCIGGSSAIGEELPKFMGEKLEEAVEYRLDTDNKNGVLVVSGSLTPQTRAQTSYLKRSGIESRVIDSRLIFEDEKRDGKRQEIIEEVGKLLVSGKDILIMADDNEEVIRETKEIGKKLNIDELKVSKMVSAMLAEITGKITESINLKRLVVAGGDTSGTVCRNLGIKGNYVLEEIETGLPSGLAIGKDIYIVLKSGSFGKTEFLDTAINHLKKL